MWNTTDSTRLNGVDENSLSFQQCQQKIETHSYQRYLHGNLRWISLRYYPVLSLTVRRGEMFYLLNGGGYTTVQQKAYKFGKGSFGSLQCLALTLLQGKAMQVEIYTKERVLWNARRTD
jgi:hypothetical protein